MNKYSTKRTNSNDFESYTKHRRDYSPRRSHSRNSSPDGWSPRGPSSYSSKYSRRSKERERDAKYYDGASKSRSIRSSRSPVHESSKSYKNSSGHSRDSYYENNNHSSYNSKRAHFGDWTEQISSSGKKYYYNCKTEVSQWEKPKEWLEWERKHSSKYSEKYSNHYRDKYDINSNNPKSYVYSNDCSSNSRERSKSFYGSRQRSPSYRSHDSKTRDTVKKSSVEDKKDRADVKEFFKKDESPTCPLKSTDSQCNIMNNNHILMKNDKTDSSKLNNISISSNSNNNSSKSTVEHVKSISNSILQPDQPNLSSALVSTLATLVSAGKSPLSLSKLLCQLTNSHGIKLSQSPNDDALNILKKALNCAQKQQNNTNQTPTSQNSPRNPSVQLVQQNSLHSKRESHSNKNHTFPQYRHLNSADGIRQDLDQLSKSLLQSPTSDSKTTVSTSRNDSSTSSLSTISSVMSSSASQKSCVPNLSRFKHLYREDLLNNVVGWHSELLEKQVSFFLIISKFFKLIFLLALKAASFLDQANHIGNHLCTRVSVELKTSRSLVRLLEIQKTLQKQR